MTKEIIIYLASPYTTDDKYIKEQRVLGVSKVACELMQQGKIIFSPVAMGHSMAKTGDLPTNWEYWKYTCVAYLKICKAMYVLKLPDWDKSTGVLAEIEIAKELGIPIEYLEPSIYNV